MGEALFSFLFKYRAAVFDAGTITFAPPVPAIVILAAFALVVALTGWSYLRAGGRASTASRVTLVVLRTAVLAVLAVCLLRPQLILSTVVPQQNYVGILYDDSRSMRIADGGAPRAELVQQTFAADGALHRALGERFRVREFAFAEGAARGDGVASLAFDGGRSRLATALQHARADLASLPLSGLVVVSDGASGDDPALTDALLELEAAGMPVFTVGVGATRLDRDIELSRVSAPAAVLAGSSLGVDLVVRQTGFAGDEATITVEDEGAIVASQSIELPEDGEAMPVRVQFTADEPGARRYRFRIAPRDDERIVENNQQEALLQVRDAREKILYFEGEPRFEVKFLRRALADDGNVQLVVLQRTADNRFLRLEVDSAGELADGFPRTRAELFRYRALVLGSVEASYFTHEQLRMIADFVGERGGGLLMLGGRRAFAEGGWAGTPVADVLPVALDAGRGGDSTYFRELRVAPTRAGIGHAALRLGTSDDDERWRSLPALSVFNRVERAKPGASVLLTGEGGQIVLAAQRYGRGQAIAFTPHDSWLWQMHADMPLEDETHETFWRQMLRWLVDGVPQQVTVRAAHDHVAPGEMVRFTARVADDAYIGINGGDVIATVTSPDGSEAQLPLSWTLEEDGEYEGSFAATTEGLHGIRVTARLDSGPVESEPAWVRVAPSTSEYFDAAMNEPLLRRVAEETGGRYYPIERADNLADDLAVTGRGATLVEARELWDMPVLLLLMVTLIGVEWTLRRRKGLA